MKRLIKQKQLKPIGNKDSQADTRSQQSNVKQTLNQDSLSKHNKDNK